MKLSWKLHPARQHLKCYGSTSKWSGESQRHQRSYLAMTLTNYKTNLILTWVIEAWLLWRYLTTNWLDLKLGGVESIETENLFNTSWYGKLYIKAKLNYLVEFIDPVINYYFKEIHFNVYRQLPLSCIIREVYFSWPTVNADMVCTKYYKQIKNSWVLSCNLNMASIAVPPRVWEHRKISWKKA